MEKKITKKDVICIICARSGSKGLKDKNILKINDIPLIAYPIIQAKKSKKVGTVLVTTDSKKIAKIAKHYGAVVPFIRPKSLAKDNTTTEKTLKHALLTYEKIVNHKFKIGVYLSASDIFRNKKWIDQSVSKLIQDDKPFSVFLMDKIEGEPSSLNSIFDIVNQEAIRSERERSFREYINELKKSYPVEINPILFK